MIRISLLTYAGLGLVAVACGSNRPGPETPATDVSVVRSGETTVVSIQDHNDEPENASCKAYCDQLTACWYAMPNVDPMLTSKDVFAKCWSEQHQCKTPTTEVHCCGSVADCGDFVRCENRARDVVTDCGHQSQNKAASGAP
jgi:hypothetical protein